MKSILHLTLLRRWFDAIARGEKTWEYRSIKPYWTRRLVKRHYDEVHFRNGYSPRVPFMRVEFKGVEITKDHNGKTCYGIKLGKILELRNYPTQQQPEAKGE